MLTRRLVIVKPLMAMVLVSLICNAGIAQDSHSLAQLSWLQGCWNGTDRQAEECWSSPAGGVMLGYGRTIRQNGTAGFEHLRIIQRDGNVLFIAQPGGGSPTEFTASAIGERFVRFANPDHDFPRVIEYQRTADSLTATIGDGLTIENSENTVTFRFERRQSQIKSELSGAHIARPVEGQKGQCVS